MPRTKLWHGFVFALIAGPATLLWLVIAARVFGYASAAGLAGLGWVILHPLFIAPKLRPAVIAALVTALLALPVAVWRPDPAVVVALVPVLLGIARSAIIYPRPIVRAIALEICFSGLGLVIGAFFYDGSAVGLSFAVWVFWLVQAGFALAGGEPSTDTNIDPFERAAASALAVLERRPR